MNENMNSAGYELGWDSEIENEGTPFVLAEPGDYNFTVTGMERARFAGSEKMPACNQAKLTLRLEMPDGTECNVNHNLFLHSKTEWKLCEFFTAIGQRQKGQRIAPNWNNLIGAKGRCQITKRAYRGKDGSEKWTNDVVKFYEPDSGLPFTGPTQTAPTYQQPTQQAAPAYQQPSGQAAAWQANQQQSYAQQSFGGYTAGKF